MDGNKKYWLQEIYRHLELALIGVREKTRKHIESAIECLEKYEKENK